MKIFGKKGFTLLELLVVISIIGILVAMGAVAYSIAQKKARNARRIGDMKAMQAMFEQYYAKNGKYIAAINSSAALTMTSPAPVPVDPKNTAPYIYWFNPFNSDSVYGVCAFLECTIGTDCIEGNHVNAAGGMSNTGTDRSEFCITNLQ